MDRNRKRPKGPKAYLVDECLGPDVRDWINEQKSPSMAVRIGDEGYKRVTPPRAGMKDPQLPSWLESMMFITKDKRCLLLGRMPNRHAGIFVFDAGNRTLLDVVKKFFLADLPDDLDDEVDTVNRRFLISRDKIIEYDLDHNKITEWGW